MAKPTMSGFLRGFPAARPQPAPVTPQQFPPHMPFDAFGFLPPGVQLPGETTIAPMLREVEDMRRANQGMLRQIEADTAGGPVMQPPGVLEASEPAAPTQRMVQSVPQNLLAPPDASDTPYEDPLVSPTARPGRPNSAPPMFSQQATPQRAEDIFQGAQQAQAANNGGDPWQTTTKAEPGAMQMAFGKALMSDDGPQGGGSPVPAPTPMMSTPRPRPETIQPSRLPMPTLASMLRGA